MQPTALQWIQLWQVLIVHFSKAYLDCSWPLVQSLHYQSPHCVLHTIAMTAVNSFPLLCACIGFCVHALMRCLCCCPAIIPLAGCATCFTVSLLSCELMSCALICLTFARKCLIGSTVSLLTFAYPVLHLCVSCALPDLGRTFCFLVFV